MSRSTVPSGPAAATLDAAEEYVAARVGHALEAVFDAVAATRADTNPRLAPVGPQGRPPGTPGQAPRPPRRQKR
ncbi:hypothetical protein ABT189_42755, partial [Streptomyces sp900105755]